MAACIRYNRDANFENIYLQIITPQLYIKSRKAPKPEGFVQHSSTLETIKNHPIYLIWNSGTISKIYRTPSEPQSLLNYKKGIASLFQFQLLDGTNDESDASGSCTVIYTSIDPHSFSKTKLRCQNPSTLSHPNPLFSTSIKSQRQATYNLNYDNNRLESIVTQEVHKTETNYDANTNIHTIQKLQFVSDGSGEVYKAPTLQSVLQKIEGDTGFQLVEDTLVTQPEDMEGAISFAKGVKENKEWLRVDKLGTVKSANAFLKLVTIARRTGKEEFMKVLKHARNKEIL